MGSKVGLLVGKSAVEGEEGPIKPLVTALGVTASKPASSCSQGWSFGAWSQLVEFFPPAAIMSCFGQWHRLP